MEFKRLRICCVTAIVLMSELLMESAGLTTTEVTHVGGIFKLRCPVLASSTMRWLKNNRSLNLKAVPHIKIKKKGTVLKINNVKLEDAAKYSCDEKVNRTWTRVETWRLKVVPHQPDQDEPACGRPIKDHLLVKDCIYERNLPRCNSFPAKPLEVKVTLFLHKDLPAIYVKWEAPLSGYNDLWGFAIHLLGVKNDVNKQECYQINHRIKPNYTHVSFYTENKSTEVSVRFGAEYLVTLTSLPGRPKNENSLKKRVLVPEKCQWKEFQDIPECYTVSNLTARATAKFVSKEEGWKINVTWEQNLKHTDSILYYEIHWLTYPEESRIYNYTTVGANQTYITFRIPPVTRCLNLTIVVSGKTISGAQTKRSSTELSHIGDCTRREIPPKAIKLPDEKTLKTVIIVGSIVFSILLVIVFKVIHRYYYKPVYVKLPPAFPCDGDINEPMLNSQKNKRKVYIMHSSCCEKCKWAVTQFGDLLRKTGLIDVGLDLCDTLEMLPNKPLYYEKQIRESDCVVVVTDNTMRECALTSKDGKPYDDKDVRFQLDLIRGEINREPDTRKYIPVYMSFKSTKKDIPDFLSSRVLHSLPQDIDRVVFHLLNIEKIQPRRWRRFAVIGGNDHPYAEAKSFFEAVVEDAAQYHKESQTLRNRSDDTMELHLPDVITN